MTKKKQATPQKDHLSLIQDYQAVFDTEPGRRVLLDLMKEGHVLSPIFSNTHDPNQAFLNEGKREMVLIILDKMKKNIKYLAELIEINIQGAEDEKHSNDYFREHS